MEIWEIILLFGVPSAITGLGIWLIKRKIEKNERQYNEKENNLQDLVLMMLQTTRANAVGITAVAKAIQRIPDAHCNGDMTKALEYMKAVQEKEKDFLMDKGVKHIFE